MRHRSPRRQTELKKKAYEVTLEELDTFFQEMDRSVRQWLKATVNGLTIGEITGESSIHPEVRKQLIGWAIWIVLKRQDGNIP